MLKNLRKKGVAKVILWVLATIIILAFGLFGTLYEFGTSTDNTPQFAGRIFGKKVPFQDFQDQLRQTVIVDMINYGNNYSRIREMLDQNRIERTWVRFMLLKEAEKRNIRVSDEEVVRFIQNYEPFQVSGQFNRLLYNDILRNFLRVSPREFEECLRDKLRIDRLTEAETASISVADQEVLDAYRSYNEKVKVSYVFFASEDFQNTIAIDESAAEQFYEDHKDEFLQPRAINVEFIRFDFALNQSKNPENITPEERESARNKAVQAHLALKNSSDWTSSATEQGLKIEESGFFSLEQPNLRAGWSFEVIQNIFTLQEGEMTPVIETAQGYQILRVKAIRPESLPAFHEIKETVTAQWRALEAAKLARAKAEEALKEFRDALNQSPEKPFDFNTLAKRNKWPVTQTEALKRADDYLPKLGQVPDFLTKAFTLTPENPLSEVAQTPKGFAIMTLDERIEADLSEFEKERATFANALLMDKKTKAFNAFLTALRSKAGLESFLPEN